MHPEAKRSHYVTVSSTDKFSSLHESIVSRILSHLPTVEAVRTCVLSKSWRHMWTSVTDLHFDDRILRDPKDFRFSDFVDRVLGRISTTHINSFYLRSVNSYDESLVIPWLSTVLQRDLQRLDITCLEFESVNFSPLFSNFGSLVELRLCTKSMLDLSAPALLPNLKFLALEDARIFNMSSVSKNIYLSFPVLESFEASRCCCFKTDTIVIDSPLLRVFEMYKCSSEHVPNSSRVCKIRLLSSKLEKVTFSKDHSQKIVLSFPPSLPDAYLALSNVQWCNKFLRSFTCVKSLGLELSDDFGLLFKLPKFRQLVYLHLIYDMSQYSILRKFLKSTPMLKMLSIHDQASPGSISSSEVLKKLRSKEAPHCVRTMLKVLQIRNFKASELQLSVLKYVMGNAESLGPVILCTHQPMAEESKGLVLSYPQASPHASVFFEIIKT